MRRFKDIAKDAINDSVLDDIVLDISGVSSDSREDQKDKVFIAYNGVAADGHNYINQAISKGAVAVVGERNIDNLSVPYFQVPNGRMAWGIMMANWYDRPDRNLRVIGVTGTDGKTTTTTLIYEVLQSSGFKCGMTSTVAAKIAGRDYDTGFHTTTSDPDEMWKFMKMMSDSGEDVAILEVTSHALDQYRLGDLQYEVGVLTNVTPEHLDYHKTMENYRAAKSLLFQNSKISILNINDPSYDFMKQTAKDQVIAYDTKNEAKERHYEISPIAITQIFQLKYGNDWINVNTPLLGDYNIDNILAVSKVAQYFRVSPEIFALTVANFNQIPGRFQVVPNNRNFHTIIDFAHTENAMRRVLSLVREIKQEKEKIIIVFGCASQRDNSKRSFMGKTACELADSVVITNEDPRLEDPAKIFSEIEAGCIQTGAKINEKYYRIDDRNQAIDFAINKLAKPGDWVLSLGKGHETSICIGKEETPWSELEAMKKALDK